MAEEINYDPAVVLEALNNKADRDLGNISEKIDYVVEQSDNYIKYKSGKLICWGITAALSGRNERTITLPKPYANTSYVINITPRSGGSENVYSNAFQSQTVNTSHFTARSTAIESNLVAQWTTIGQGAK